jgi:hypothetical protein
MDMAVLTAPERTPAARALFLGQLAYAEKRVALFGEMLALVIANVEKPGIAGIARDIEALRRRAANLFKTTRTDFGEPAGVLR